MAVGLLAEIGHLDVVPRHRATVSLQAGAAVAWPPAQSCENIAGRHQPQRKRGNKKTATMLAESGRVRAPTQVRLTPVDLQHLKWP